MPGAEGDLQSTWTRSVKISDCVDPQFRDLFDEIEAFIDLLPRRADWSRLVVYALHDIRPDNFVIGTCTKAEAIVNEMRLDTDDSRRLIERLEEPQAMTHLWIIARTDDGMMAMEVEVVDLTSRRTGLS